MLRGALAPSYRLRGHYPVHEGSPSPVLPHWRGHFYAQVRTKPKLARPAAHPTTIKIAMDKRRDRTGSTKKPWHGSDSEKDFVKNRHMDEVSKLD